MTSTTPISDPNDVRIYAAATGLSPALADTDDLPGTSLHFATNTATYRVTNDGRGTLVNLYGTTSRGHSICVRAENFRPYVCVDLTPLERVAQNETVFKLLVENLIDELQVRLLAIAALDPSQFSPEREAFRKSYAGAYVDFKARDQCALKAATRECNPIVDWDIVAGRSMRGTGPGSGYRGMKGQRYLRLYTYSPPLVPIIRDLLRGKHAELGVMAQVERMSQGRRKKRKSADELLAEAAEAAKAAAAAGGVRPRSALTKKAELRHYKKISAWDPQAYVITDNDADVADDEDDDPHDDDIIESDGEADERMLAQEQLELQAQLASDEIEEDENYEGDVDDNEARQQIVNLQKQYLIQREMATVGDGDDPGDTNAAVDADDDATEDSREDPVKRDRAFTRWYPATDQNVDALKSRLEKRFIRRALHGVLGASPQRRAMLDRCTYDIYDGDMDFTLRMMIDSRFKPEQWVKIDFERTLHTLPNGRLLREPLRPLRAVGNMRDTRQQIELHCDYRFLECNADDPMQTVMPQHCTASLDGEMRPGPKMEFPVPKKEPMLTTVWVVKDWRDLDTRPKPAPGKFYYRSVSFTLGTVECNSAPREYCSERHILSFATERDLYLGMAKFIALLNPQIVSGYNSDSFDLPYLLERAEEVGAGKVFANAWGKTRFNSRMTVRERIFESSAVGKIVFKDIQAPGLETLDLFLKIKKDPQFKERDMSLNAIAYKYIEEQKDDVAYSDIRHLQQSETGREKLRVYCEKDALLPLEIMEALKMVSGMIEMSRLCGVTVGMLVKRGMQIRAKCALFSIGLVTVPRCMFYTRTDEERLESKDDSYAGATVINPKVGLYDEPVDTLDFEGLYPAIMRLWNLCFSTRVDDDYDLTKDPDIMRCADPERELTPEERQRRADDAVFVIMEIVPKSSPVREQPFLNKQKKRVRVLRHEHLVGIIPLTLHEYAAARKKAKADKKDAERAGNAALVEIFDLKQNSIKLLMNSMYGYLGSPTSGSFTPDMAAAVTCRGRWLLELTAEKVVAHFGPILRARAEAAAGHALPADLVFIDIVYGDTDSVFVHLPQTKSVEAAALIGVEMAKFMTDYLKSLYPRADARWNVLVLAFEKTLRRLLLLAKKKYAYLRVDYNANGTLCANPGDGIPTLSGLDGKRRDQTLLIGDNFMDMVATLLDYRYDTKTNLRRLRKFVWERMVTPVLTNTVNLRLLSISKQVRKLAKDYTTNKAGQRMSAPIQVQVFEKEVNRAGGPDAAGAPQTGDRMSYVVTKGQLKEKVSSRGETPVHVLRTGMKIDSRYYLDKHIKPSVLRLVVPIICKGRIQFGRTDAARLKAEKHRASEYMFGHKTDYVDRFAADKALGEIVPMTMTARMEKDEKSKKRVSQKMLPRYDQRTHELVSRPRFESTRLQLEEDAPPRLSSGAAAVSGIVPPGSGAKGVAAAAKLPVVHRQRNIASFSAHGVLCESCKRFSPGRTVGFVCDDCIAKKPQAVAKSVDSLCKMLSDIEDLNRERALLVDRCNDCVGCRDAPRKITCENTSCPTLWDRKLNLRSLDEAERRVQTLSDIVERAHVLPALDLYEDERIDSAVHEKKRKINA